MGWQAVVIYPLEAISSVVYSTAGATTISTQDIHRIAFLAQKGSQDNQHGVRLNRVHCHSLSQRSWSLQEVKNSKRVLVWM